MAVESCLQVLLPFYVVIAFWLKNLFKQGVAFFILMNKLILIGLIAVCLAGSLPWFQEGWPATDDFRHHLTKFWHIEQSVKSGQWFEWMPFIYSGWPLTQFYHSLPYFVSVPFLFFINSFSWLKFNMAFAFVLSVITSYYAASKLLGNDWSGFFASALFVLLPLHFEFMYVSGSVSRMWAYAFLPLVFYGFVSLLENPCWKRSCLFAVYFSLLLLTNINLTYVVCLVLFLFWVFQRFKAFKFILVSGVLAGLLCSFWLLPLLLESGGSGASFSLFGNAPNSMSFESVFSRNFEGHPFYAGIALCFFALVSLAVVKFKHRFVFGVCFLLFLFLALFAKLVVVLPFSSLIVFSYYFMLVSLFFACLLVGRGLGVLSAKSWLAVLIVFVICVVDVYPGVVAYNWVSKPTEQFVNPKDIINCWSFIGKQPGYFRVFSSVGELPFVYHGKFEVGGEWMGYREGALKPMRKAVDDFLAKPDMEVLREFGVKYVVSGCSQANPVFQSGQFCVYGFDGYPLVDSNATVSNLVWRNSLIGFDVDGAGGNVIVRSMRFGSHWKAFVDGSRVEINSIWPDYMQIVVPEGKHSVRFLYGASTVQYVGLVLSFTGLAVLVLLTRKSAKSGVPVL